jgi:hypothetical protein
MQSIRKLAVSIGQHQYSIFNGIIVRSQQQQFNITKIFMSTIIQPLFKIG